jgi:hypothetical protein
MESPRGSILRVKVPPKLELWQASGKMASRCKGDNQVEVCVKISAVFLPGGLEGARRTSVGSVGEYTSVQRSGN